MFETILKAVAAPVIGGLFGAVGQKQANAANANQADKQNDFNWEAMRAQQDFGRETIGRQEDFQTQATAKQMDFGREVIGRQENFQREAAQTQMDYQTQMSGTAYQRAMADMRAAGLNPMLAYGQGGATSPAGSAPSGASASAAAPSGATASSSAAQGTKAHVEDWLSPGITRALQGARIFTELEQLQASVENTKANTGMATQSTASSAATEALTRAQTITESRRPDLLRAQYQTELRRPSLVESQAQSARASAGQTERENERFDNWGPRTSITDHLAAGEAATRRGVRAAESLPPDNPIANFLRRARDVLQ